MDNKYKIVGICQVYNEIERGNFDRFLKYFLPLIDELVIFDDGSTDGSYELALSATSHVIRRNQNDFLSEVSSRSQLLAKAKELHADFVLWLDVDEIFDIKFKENIYNICRQCIDGNFDAVSFHEVNLWRSYLWKRVDGLFDAGWYPRLWRVTHSLEFDLNKVGLHTQVFPASIKRVLQYAGSEVLHFGFSSELLIAYKFLTYQKVGQSGQSLLRIVDERDARFEEIDVNNLPTEFRGDNRAPQKLSLQESFAYLERYKQQILKPKYSIVCLIYKSIEWLEFVYEQVLKYTDMSDKEFFFVANDATPEVLAYLKMNSIPHYIHENTLDERSEWYINNVYRAYNAGGHFAKGDFLVFINSDMAFSDNWIENLIASYDGANCVASRLIESGKLTSALPAIEKNFGNDFSDYDENAFISYSNLLREPISVDSGLFMPLLIRKDKFLEIGGYPEGNIVAGSDIFNPQIAERGHPLISGDVVLMEKLKTIGVLHRTSFSSLVYHFQEGEKDSLEISEEKSNLPRVAICNDIATGTMGEKVLWDFLNESILKSVKIDQRVVGGSPTHLNEKIQNYIQQKHPQLEVLIQNATFLGPIEFGGVKVAFLQDDLRAMGRSSFEQEQVLAGADFCVTNSIHTAASYWDFKFEVIPVGIDSELFNKYGNKEETRQREGLPQDKKIGIFVGDFTETKGWSKVKECIEVDRDVFWILVSKSQDQPFFINAKIYNRISQEMLVKLLNAADFFMIGSPVETQCLAAIEAALCGLPLVMRKVGIFKEFSESDLKALGYFGEDFKDGMKQIFKMSYSTRDVILKYSLDLQSSMQAWMHLVCRAQELARTRRLKNTQKITQKTSIFTRIVFMCEFHVRRYILRPILKRDSFYTINEISYFLRENTPPIVFQLLRSLWRVVRK